MQRCAVLLRGVNVGRAHRLPMADFRAVLAAVGCTDVSTYLQSGNALVTAEPDGLAERVEAALPLPARAVVLRAAELTAAVQRCPWPEQADAAPTSVHVAYLDRPAEPDWIVRVGTRHGDDELAAGPRVLYLRFAGPSHSSPLQRVLGRLDRVVTARNWTTARRLAELAGPG